MERMALSSSKLWVSLRRLLVVIGGLFIMSIGIVCTYRSGLGLGPWDVLHQGISRHTPLTFGQATMLVGGLIIIISLLLKVRPGISTILNMLLVGIFVDLQLHENWLPDLSKQFLMLRVLVDLVGVFLMGLGTAFYLAPLLGAGPRDGLMLSLHDLTQVRITVIRTFLEGLALLTGFLLGGTVGIGTFLFAFGVGPSVEFGFCLVERFCSILGLEYDGTKKLDRGIR